MLGLYLTNSKTIFFHLLPYLTRRFTMYVFDTVSLRQSRNMESNQSKLVYIIVTNKHIPDFRVDWFL
jgi:hypothetical protein